MEYREVIRREFRKKKSRDTYYSIQRFAEDLDLTVVQMIGVFRGRGNIPCRKALKIARRLGLEGFAARRFSFAISL